MSVRNSGLVAILCAMFSTTSSANSWPSVSTDIPPTGAGANDAAVIVGISDYFGLPDINGAVENATDWNRYLVNGRGVPSSRVRLLRNGEATKETIEENLKEAAREVRPGGTLWFIYIGHGAPNERQDDGLVLGADTQATLVSLRGRGLPQKRILEIIEEGAHQNAVVIFDACFSGTTGDGKTNLLPNTQATVPVRRVDVTAGRTAIFSASDDVAGPLPGHDRPAFSYLLLGAARGWADGNKDRIVTLVEAYEYVKDVLVTMVRDRNQVPTLKGNKEFALATGVGEAGPNLVDMQEKLLVLPGAASTLEFEKLTAPTIDPRLVTGVVFGSGTDIKVERAREDALDTAESRVASASSKRDAWCRLADMKENNPYLDDATQLCANWRKFIEDQAKLEQRLSADYDTLVDYLDLRRRTPEQKIAAATSFIERYKDFQTRQELKAARLAIDNLQKGQPPGIHKDLDGDGLFIDACPGQAEDFDGDADDDGCPETSLGEATGEAIGGAVRGTGRAIEDAGEALEEAGFRLHLVNFGYFRLDVGAHFGFGLWDEPNLIPTKPDVISFKPLTALTTRFTWGPIETGLTFDWDLARDLEDNGGYVSGHAGIRIFGVGPWTPSFGVDSRNLGATIGFGRGDPNLGLYLGNTFRIGEGFSARLTYRYGLDPVGGVVPVHAVFFELSLLALSPKGSALLEIMEELFDSCD
jgi:hypothetical protein